jgi:hypothetical protein
MRVLGVRVPRISRRSGSPRAWRCGCGGCCPAHLVPAVRDGNAIRTSTIALAPGPSREQGRLDDGCASA